MLDLCLIALPNPALSNPLMYFPLGNLYIASTVKKQGYDVKIVDYRGGIREYLPPARFYGFSCTTPEITQAKDIAQKVKGHTIVGGAHPSLCPEDCMFYFDTVVVGEGEHAIIEILGGKSGLVKAPRIKDLDSIPFPAWDLVESPFSEELFPGERYGKGQKAMTLLASRGCPYSCSFCGNLFTSVSYRSVSNIIGELKELMRRGVHYFRFEDDNFTLHPEFELLCTAIKKLRIKYKCHTRSNLLTLEKARLMAESGCEECGLGVESADNRVLKVNNKRETAEDHKQAILTLRNVGIRSKTYFIAGLPGETYETIEINKAFFRDVKPDKWTLSTFTPYPGCDIFRNPQKYEIEITEPDWSTWWNFSEGYNHVLKGQTQEQMWNRYKEFYSWLKSGQWQNS